MVATFISFSKPGFFLTGFGWISTYCLAIPIAGLTSGMGTAGTLSSGNILPDSLIIFKISRCSFDPGTTGLSGEMIALASRKFILLGLDNIEHIYKVRCCIGAYVRGSWESWRSCRNTGNGALAERRTAWSLFWENRIG